jgi:hypothetical protein
MNRIADTLKILRMIRNGELQDPERASVIPCELWDEFYKADAERFLLLATSELAEGITDEDRINVLQDAIAQNSTDCFMRGLSLGYRAFGHREAANDAVSVNLRLAHVHNIQLLASIIQSYGSEFMESYLEIEAESEEDTDVD